MNNLSREAAIGGYIYYAGRMLHLAQVIYTQI